MSKDLLNTESIIELHEKLNEFAIHHENKGGQKAHQLVKSIWDESKLNTRDGSKEGIIHDKGFDLAFETVLDALYKRFVP